MFLYTAVAWAQKIDPILQGIDTALSQGNCGKAQKLYNAWKESGGSDSSSVESRIKECRDAKKPFRPLPPLTDTIISTRSTTIRRWY